MKPRQLIELICVDCGCIFNEALIRQIRGYARKRWLMITPPCKNCPDRNALCHTICERYNMFRDAKNRENEMIHNKKQLNRSLETNEIERRKRFKRRPTR